MTMTRHAIIHAQLITPDEVIQDGAVVWSGSTIERVGTCRELAAELFQCSERIDATGKIVTPGFIDMHLHGATGYDVGDSNPTAIQTISHFLIRHGVTAFLGAAGYDEPALRVLDEMTRIGTDGAELLGIYLEGPFINPEKRGGIPADRIRPPAQHTLDQILSSLGRSLRVMVVAPELPGALDMIPQLRAAGIVPALGHSSATLDQGHLAAALGATHLTHLFNAMSGLHHREPGLAALIFDHPEATAEIVVDGVHIHPSMLRLITSLPQPSSHLALITDSVRPTGLPDGDYTHMGRPMRLSGNRAALLDGTLVGSTLTLDRAIANTVQLCNLPPQQAIHMATLLPAKILGLERERGQLTRGTRADLAILNPDLTVETAYLAGALKFSRSA